MKVQAVMTTVIVLAAAVVPLPTLAGDISVQAPLTFKANRSSDKAYDLNWALRMAEEAPVKAGVKIGWAATDEGQLASLPMRVTANIGNYDDATETIRRAIELSAGRENRQGVATLTARRVRPITLTNLDAELRQSVTTDMRGGESRMHSELKASQTLVFSEVAPSLSLQATTSVTTAAKGLAARIKVEQRLAPAITVSADFGHNVEKNSANFSARYDWNW